MHVRHCLGHLNIVIWWVRLHPTFLDSVSGQDLYEVHEYRLTINTRIKCIYVCDHECVREKSITIGSFIYALCRRRLYLLQ